MNTAAFRILAACAALAWPVAHAADPMDAAAESGAAVKAALASPDRPKADLEQDARRKPRGDARVRRR